MEQAKYSTACATVGLVTLLGLFAILWISPGESRAEGLSGYLEHRYEINDTDSVDAGGQSVRTHTESLFQLYNITLDKRLYPNLRVLASGIFRRLDASTEVNGVESETTLTAHRPHVSLNLRTPLYQADADYSRNEEKIKSSGSPSFTTVRELV